MTYQETLDYLFNKLPMFSHLGADAFKKDLTNTIKLCEALGNPHHQFKSIHIAGTNGKGSTSHLLAAILQTAGYKTGLYTSPHLKDFRERIKIDGAFCSEEFVVDFTNKIKPLIEEIEPSFFEITVAMAFTYFAQQKVDIAVIEVGLGGRLDSTNIITPELCIITNIGWDHTNLLGNTLPLIAYEKAGIIKKGIPVVIGETLPETKSVFEEKANSLKAPITFAQQKRYVSDFSIYLHKMEVEIVELETDIHEKYQLDLNGIYQTHNLLTVLEAVNQINHLGYTISQSVVKDALKQIKRLTGLHGRWQVIQTNPTIVLDVAHNEDGIKQLLSQLEHCTYSHLHIVIGMVKDKDIDKALQILPKHANYYFTNAQIPRALSADKLKEIGKNNSLHGNCYIKVVEALNAAKNKAIPEDLILVCGSVFVVGEVEY